MSKHAKIRYNAMGGDSRACLEQQHLSIPFCPIPGGDLRLSPSLGVRGCYHIIYWR